jgi:hypothetical protein
MATYKVGPRWQFLLVCPHMLEFVSNFFGALHVFGQGMELHLILGVMVWPLSTT